ncbi:putative transposase [Formivibrio citricus]|uniref:Putative transposase n=1 Tax=Formivibrio citricus TaxID=83765 RepID=A0A1I4W6X9_9NEIS|nr:transposase [Formivibrio citricus]SFN09215.1 putative transposase [Formivibrio citricus]
MARLPRFVLPGHPQHVMVRGNNREPIFSAEEDYRFYLGKLQDAAKLHQCDIHAYVLMTNHVHLLVTAHMEDGISKMIQRVGRYYVQYFNYLYQRTGTLWEGRYKASLIDGDAYALTCYRYIEMNPVRAGMVDHPADYPWSSYRGNALGVSDPLLVPHTLYQSLGQSAEDRKTAYRALFNVLLDQKTLDEVRSSINKAWVLGDSRFKEKVAALLDRRVEPLQRGGDRKSEKFKINRV